LKILIVTDAWAPQVNGVVRTLEMLGQDLRALGHEVRYATPEGYFSLPFADLSRNPACDLPAAQPRSPDREFVPDAIHIATEGTLGLSARAICLKRRLPFSSAYHTRFPDYVHARFPFISENMVYRFLSWFHGPPRGDGADPGAQARTRGARFHQCAHLVARRRCRRVPSGGERVAALSAAALALCRTRRDREEHRGFLSLDLPGTKVVVGDGPARVSLSEKFRCALSRPQIRRRADAALRCRRRRVFPSKTETFGLVMLERSPAARLSPPTR